MNALDRSWLADAFPTQHDHSTRINLLMLLSFRPIAIFLMKERTIEGAVKKVDPPLKFSNSSSRPRQTSGPFKRLFRKRLMYIYFLYNEGFYG